MNSGELYKPRAITAKGTSLWSGESDLFVVFEILVPQPGTIVCKKDSEHNPAGFMFPIGFSPCGTFIYLLNVSSARGLF